jgi:hypothetical protein
LRLAKAPTLYRARLQAFDFRLPARCQRPEA